VPAEKLRGAVGVILKKKILDGVTFVVEGALEAWSDPWMHAVVMGVASG